MQTFERGKRERFVYHHSLSFCLYDNFTSSCSLSCTYIISNLPLSGHRNPFTLMVASNLSVVYALDRLPDLQVSSVVAKERQTILSRSYYNFDRKPGGHERVDRIELGAFTTEVPLLYMSSTDSIHVARARARRGIDPPTDSLHVAPHAIITHRPIDHRLPQKSASLAALMITLSTKVAGGILDCKYCITRYTIYQSIISA